MPSDFKFSASPFDCLNPAEQRLVLDNVQEVRFPEGATILELGAAPAHLFVIIQGRVAQFDGNEVLTTYVPDDCFDGRALVAGKSGSRFVAVQEVVAHQLAKQAVIDLIADNPSFGAGLFADPDDKLHALADRHNLHQMRSLSMARVDQAIGQPVHVVDHHTDILSVVKLFRQHRTASVLVRDTAASPPRLGLFAATDLTLAILDGRPLDQVAVGELTNFALCEVRPSDWLGDAIALMLRHRIHHVVVADEGEVRATLEALDMVGLLANHSLLITKQIETATDLSGLSLASAQITRMLTSLHRGGSRVSLIARLVQQLNAQLFERAWRLIAPAELVANSCLFVMGSEGRGEQLLKTDQDNGLILRDDYLPPADLAAVCQRFSDALCGFGYPDCPGGIMVSNPDWRKCLSEFGEMTQLWLLQPGPDSLMKLAIFMDARSVCGDESLLKELRLRHMRFGTDNAPMLARFASAIDTLGSSNGWWNRLLGLDNAEGLNLKKEGIFPLVHGIRSLALAHQVMATSTVTRIEALVTLGKLPAELGEDLRDSLHFLMGLRLQAGLAELDSGHPVSGAIDQSRLSSLDRGLLKIALGMVRKLRTLLRLRLRLDIL